MLSIGLLLSLLLIGSTLAARDPKGFIDGHDLDSFVTRPDLRPPRYHITKHHPEAIKPGYWFVAHYPVLFTAPSTWRKEHVPWQTGIHIYDNDGNLVWSGARDYRNSNAFDFRSYQKDGEYYLSAYVEGVMEDNVPDDWRKAGGVTMNNRYKEMTRTRADDSEKSRSIDSHEFTVRPEDNTAILSMNFPDGASGADIGREGDRAILIYGFQEVDIETGKSVFEWNPIAHGVSLNESVDIKHMAGDAFWDWFHLNSVDKNADGDYLVSGRHVSTLFKVSGQDGGILWRLGGAKSDFKLKDGVHFDWQHHARFLFENETTTIISVFDNASEDDGRNPDIPKRTSVGKIIKLDHTTMTASILRSFERPDGKWTVKLGSVQTLGDDPLTTSVFINWADSSYLSEYDGDDRLVMEAQLESNRMWNYRAYKLPWVGRPSEPIMLKGLPNVYNGGRPAVTYYVSWNGATEVQSWAFYSCDTMDGPFEKIGSVPKVGFETAWTTTRIHPYTYVQGIDKNGEVLGESNATTLLVAKQWNFEGSVDADSIDDDEGSEPLNILASVPWLIVYALALYAVYVVIKGLIPGMTKKRDGYLKVSSYEPDESMLELRRHDSP